MKNIDTKDLLTPVAIIIAAIMISVSLFSLGQAGGSSAVDEGPSLDNIAKITKDDHIRGDIKAPIKIVEYSDTECPFCKRFHETMKQVMAENKNVAWVYRHFPLDSLHPKARKEAEALECAGEIGGNEKFWQYTDRVYEVTPANNGLDLADLPKIAQYVGLDVAKFNACLESGKYAERIEEQAQNAQNTGGEGTPWSILVTKSGKKYPISGALPYESIKQLIELALKE